MEKGEQALCCQLTLPQDSGAGLGQGEWPARGARGPSVVTGSPALEPLLPELFHLIGSLPSQLCIFILGPGT